MAAILPDLLRPGLRIVFCGSAAGNESARRKAYYAHRQNRFWPTLHATGLTPRLFRPEEYPALLALGIGLTDVCKTASGGDRDLPRGSDDPAALRRKIDALQPGVLAFAGKRPAEVFLGRKRPDFGLQPETVGATRLFVLPSPSPAAVGHWDERWWHELARRFGPAVRPRD